MILSLYNQLLVTFLQSSLRAKGGLHIYDGRRRFVLPTPAAYIGLTFRPNSEPDNMKITDTELMMIYFY